MAESGLNESLLPLLVLRPPTDPIEEPSFGLKDISTSKIQPRNFNTRLFNHGLLLPWTFQTFLSWKSSWVNTSARTHSRSGLLKLPDFFFKFYVLLQSYRYNSRNVDWIGRSQDRWIFISKFYVDSKKVSEKFFLPPLFPLSTQKSPFTPKGWEKSSLRKVDFLSAEGLFACFFGIYIKFGYKNPSILAPSDSVDVAT